MKRIFVIEYPDDLGPFWMNKDNLLLCLNAYCPNTKFKISDITDKVSDTAYFKECLLEAISKALK